MKRYDRICIVIFLAVILICAGINIAFYVSENSASDREYNVEIERLSRQIEAGETPDIDTCKYVTNIEEFDYINNESEYKEKDNETGDSESADDSDINMFLKSSSNYVIKETGGKLYRFDYKASSDDIKRIKLIVNISMTMMVVILLVVLS